MLRHRTLIALSLLGAAVATTAHSQDPIIRLPTDSIERLLRTAPYTVVAGQDSRYQGDRTQHLLLSFDSTTALEVKWAKAPVGGQAFNNQPRYEAAAYELQKLFLDPPNYVVPPTVLRMVPLSEVAQRDRYAEATFSDAASVLIVVQYWADFLTDKGVFDKKRVERDSVYARHLGDLNVLTYLIRHSDANAGNILISQDSSNPRLFAVDNGVSFASPPSNRGSFWRDLRVTRLGRTTAERLQKIRREDLDRALGVLAQFDLREGEYHEAAKGESIDDGTGVRRKGNVLQLGLTDSEIAGVHDRLKSLVKRIQDGKLATF
jgi:hypothetical protein